MSAFSLSDLERIVATRAAASPDRSWTAKLVAAGQERAAKNSAKRRWKPSSQPSRKIATG